MHIVYIVYGLGYGLSVFYVSHASPYFGHVRHIGILGILGVSGLLGILCISCMLRILCIICTLYISGPCNCEGICICI